MVLQVCHLISLLGPNHRFLCFILVDGKIITTCILSHTIMAWSGIGYICVMIWLSTNWSRETCPDSSQVERWDGNQDVDEFVIPWIKSFNWLKFPVSGPDMIWWRPSGCRCKVLGCVEKVYNRTQRNVNEDEKAVFSFMCSPEVEIGIWASIQCLRWVTLCKYSRTYCSLLKDVARC